MHKNCLLWSFPWVSLLLLGLYTYVTKLQFFSPVNVFDSWTSRKKREGQRKTLPPNSTYSWKTGTIRRICDKEDFRDISSTDNQKAFAEVLF